MADVVQAVPAALVEPEVASFDLPAFELPASTTVSEPLEPMREPSQWVRTTLYIDCMPVGIYSDTVASVLDSMSCDPFDDAKILNVFTDLAKNRALPGHLSISTHNPLHVRLLNLLVAAYDVRVIATR